MSVILSDFKLLLRPRSIIYANVYIIKLFFPFFQQSIGKREHVKKDKGK